MSTATNVLPLFETIIKRDGTCVAFDPTHIVQAIAKAGKATNAFDESEAWRLTRRVLAIASTNTAKQITVEYIQDVVEDVLMVSPYRQTARAYIIYREQHRVLRQLKSAPYTERINTYLDQSDWQVSENANMTYSLQGLNQHVAGDIARTYWLEQLYPPHIRKAHLRGDFHIHDLNLLAVYCVGWDLADLLQQGFCGVPGKTESKPAKHFQTALNHITNFFYTLQGEAAGAVALSSVDTLLAPFIAFDKLSYKEVKQAVQAWVFNMNVATRVGFQCPFTNITLDLNVPQRLQHTAVTHGGKLHDKTYSEFQREMDMFNKAFLEIMVEGDAKGRVFTFPIPTYNITKDFNYDDPRLDPLWKVTAKYGLPYFANFVNSEMSPDDARSMCCRLRLDNRELRRRGGGLFGADPLTGSIGVVTLNLPRLGHLARNETNFFERLDALMDTARDSLMLKRKVLEQFTESGLYPYSRHYLANIYQCHKTYWYNHFSTIGILGLEEAVQNLFGTGLHTPTTRAFGLAILDRMRTTLAKYQEETETPFNLEATPAEGTCYRLMNLDRKYYPNMPVFINETKSMVYSNSSQPPVQAFNDPFALLEQQDEFQTKYTGGTVLHFFLGERIDDPNTVKKFVRTVCTNYHLPYFTLTPTFSICPQHGYIAGEQTMCPQCDEKTEVYSRIVGYLRPVGQWNIGKQEEFKRRGLFDRKII